MTFQIVEMKVHIDCPGCESKIMKALSELDGVDSIDIDMTMQKVTVMGWADQDKVLKTVRKTGRKAELWPFPYNPDYHDNYVHYYGSPDHLYSDINSRYNGQERDCYLQPPYSAILNERTSRMFSDDNATGCSIM